ncbi:MAG: DNA polymerase III subunit beta [Pedosphaera sp.]|nr:DNA polymerase III subunit beta [Pedosphaera sp.]
MKLTIGKDQLMLGLQAVQNVVGSRTTMAILNNILLNARDGRLQVTGTDLDISVTCPVVAQISTPGAITLPARKFIGIVRELGSPEIELSLDEKKQCSIRSGSSFYKINGLAAEDYPPLPQFKEVRRVVIQQETLRAMLKKTAFAVSADESRFVLNGIFFSLKDHKATLVATDGRRLALTDGEAEIPTESQGDFIVPTKAINELTRLLQGTGSLELNFSENQVAFTLKGENGFDTVITSKLVDGSYPNYRQVIPAEPLERVAIPREEFLAALKRAEIMTSDKSNSVKLAFGRNQLTITANTPEVGEGQETLAINYKGKEMAIAFNPTYLMDPLKAVETEEVYFELIDELSPGVLKINEPFLYVIMPMRMS